MINNSIQQNNLKNLIYSSTSGSINTNSISRKSNNIGNISNIRTYTNNQKKESKNENRINLGLSSNNAALYQNYCSREREVESKEELRKANLSMSPIKKQQ